MKKKYLYFVLIIAVLLVIAGFYINTSGRKNALENQIHEFEQTPEYDIAFRAASDSLSMWHTAYLMNKMANDDSHDFVGADTIVQVGPIVFNADFSRCIVVFISRGTVRNLPVITSSLMAGEKSNGHWKFFTNADAGDLPAISVIDNPENDPGLINEAQSSALDYLSSNGLISFPMCNYNSEFVNGHIAMIKNQH